MTWLSRGIGILSLAAVLSPAGPAAVGAELEVTEVADGVFAVLQPTDNRFNQSNSTFVVGDRGVLVVDTQSSLVATAEVIAQIRSRTELPVRHLVLTHWHGDHVQGIGAYREIWPGVEVIGHRSLEQDILGRAQPQIRADIELYETAIAEAEQRAERRESREGEPLDDQGLATLEAQIEAARDTVTEMKSLPEPFDVPDLSYTDEVLLGSGLGAVRLLHRASHTRGDTVVYLPEAKVLITGDVLDDLPFGGHGYPARWVEVLEELVALDFEVIVPGHGRVRDGKQHLKSILGLFATLVEHTNRAVEQGHALEATQEQVGAALATFHKALVGDDPVAGGAWDGFIPATIERAWLEARGELPD